MFVGNAKGSASAGDTRNVGPTNPNAAVNFDVLVITYGVVNQVGGTVVGGMLVAGSAFGIAPVHMPFSDSAWLCELPVFSLGAISAREAMNEGLTPASANTARQRVGDEMEAGSIRYSCVRVQLPKTNPWGVLSESLEKAKRSDFTSRVT